MKLIFTDESRIYMSQGDDVGSFVQFHSYETDETDCPKKTSKFPKSFMIFVLYVI